jgi:hypothetical protein
LTFFEAWGGALAYSFQIYFDFSGYSDMAIGLARMFGVRLPLNFNSPYKAISIIEFWRRWHLTLSRFFRDYLYIPLGGQQKGKIRHLTNLAITMLLGGLWHGAGWTFIFWGGLHGLFLVINHVWNNAKLKIMGAEIKSSQVGKLISWMITMVVVVIAWVPFRASSIEGASNILTGMMGINGRLSLPSSWAGRLGEIEPWLIEHGIVVNKISNNGIYSEPKIVLLWIIFLLLTATLFPNTQQLLRHYRPALKTNKNELPRSSYPWAEWRPILPWTLFITSIFVIAVLSLNQISEFLYFQF